jgi:aminoglycoside 6'-N-acetyltransferase
MAAFYAFRPMLAAELPLNLRAVRAYEKARFEKVAMIETPDGPSLLMMRNS